MSLWHGSLSQFVVAASDPENYAADLSREYARKFDGESPGDAQVRAWTHSLPALASVLKATSLTSVYIAVEYQLPLSGHTVDVLVFGGGTQGKPHVILIELKQWSDVKPSGDKRFPFVVPGMVTPQRHPAGQALAYRDYLASCHSLSGECTFSAAAYLHNMGPATAAWGSLTRPEDLEIFADCHLWHANDAKFVLWLNSQFATTISQTDFERFLRGKFRQGGSFLERVRRMCLEMRLVENAAQAVSASAWTMTPEQGRLAAVIQAAVLGGERRAFVITGSPGSGKSVLALNLIKEAFIARRRCVYATGNRGLETVARESMGRWGGSIIKNVQRFKGAHIQPPTAPLDLLVVDEAQRSWAGEVEDILASARVAVFCLDENQILLPNELGTTDFIRERLVALGVKWEALRLSEQFRCEGGPGYVRWIEKLLDYDGAEPVADWDRKRYKFKVCATYDEMTRWIQTVRTVPDRVGVAVALTKKARTITGPPIRVDQQRLVAAYYNDNGSNQLNTAVSIFTIQGLELDYVGLVWGEDLIFRNGTWYVDRRAIDEQKLAGVKDQRVMLNLLKNRYRVLLTRGIKGVAVYCIDTETRQYLEKELNKAPTPWNTSSPDGPAN